MTEQIAEAQTSDVRSQRGLALAREKRAAIKALVGTKYLVPSASDNGSAYVVDTKIEACSCLDWMKLGGHDRPHRCKHLWAVIHVLKLADGSELLVAEKPDEPDEPKKKYQRHCSWKTINACRTLIPRLGPIFIEDLVDGSGLFAPKPGKRGRGAPPVPERDIVVTALLREFGQAPAGTAQVLAEDYCAAGTVHMTKVPSYNTLLERFADPALMPKLHHLLAGSALILLPFETGFSVDGTGFGTSVYDHFFTEKHGKKAQKRRPTKRSRWVEAKTVYGVRTHVIPAVQVTEQHAGEAPVMPELLRRTIANGAKVSEWYADAAYCAEECAAAVEKVGAQFFVDWLGNRTGRTKKAALWRLHQKFDLDRDLYWSHYDKGRPLAETGNMMLKTRFGHSLKSRTANTQYAEVMLRCICHNIACLVMAVQELGVEPKYWTRDLSELPDFGTTVPRTIEAAQTIEVK
jgi:hypothetical protein